MSDGILYKKGYFLHFYENKSKTTIATVVTVVCYGDSWEEKIMQFFCV